MDSSEHARTVIRRIFFAQIGILLAFVVVVVVVVVGLSIHLGEAVVGASSLCCTPLTR